MTLKITKLQAEQISKIRFEYLNQAIEIDAIRFTIIKIKELFNVKTIIPDQINSKSLVIKLYICYYRYRM